MVVTALNACGGWLPIRDAVRRGVAFCVEVRDDILAVDLDDVAQTPVLERLVTELREAGHVPVVCASGRDGHRHLFVRVRDRERWTARARDVGFKGDAIRVGNQRIRPPLAPHRLGLPVALIEPDAIDALVALMPQGRSRRLSRRMFEVLRNGDVRHEYKTTSEMALGIALAAVNKGWSEAAVYRALVNPQNVGGAKVQKIRRVEGETAARRYVRTMFQRAHNRVRVSPPTHEGAEDARDVV